MAPDDLELEELEVDAVETPSNGANRKRPRGKRTAKSLEDSEAA